jgi:hypothetical protein
MNDGSVTLPAAPYLNVFAPPGVPRETEDKAVTFISKVQAGLSLPCLKKAGLGWRLPEELPGLVTHLVWKRYPEEQE